MFGGIEEILKGVLGVPTCWGDRGNSEGGPWSSHMLGG